MAGGPINNKLGWSSRGFCVRMPCLHDPASISHHCLTEPLGLIWSLLSIPFFVMALRYNSLVAAYTAFGLITIALLTRMGAIFLVPAVLIWILLYFGKTVWQKLRILAVCIVILAAGLSLNNLLTKINGSGKNLTGSNFAYSLCGLSIGGSWVACLQKYEQELEKIPPNEKAITEFLTQKLSTIFSITRKRYCNNSCAGASGFWDEYPWLSPRDIFDRRRQRLLVRLFLSSLQFAGWCLPRFWTGTDARRCSGCSQLQGSWAHRCLCISTTAFV